MQKESATKRDERTWRKHKHTHIKINALAATHLASVLNSVFKLSSRHDSTEARISSFSSGAPITYKNTSPECLNTDMTFSNSTTSTGERREFQAEYVMRKCVIRH